MTKGRRVGFTHGAANFAIEKALDDNLRILWVDVTQGNLLRYYDRYFLPTLKKLPYKMWSFNKQQYELKIGNTIIDMRSAEKFENIEGFGYHVIIINEAGIILKGERGRYIWQNAILPMTMDYDDCIVYLGGTPKGIVGKDGLPTTYYNLYQKSQAGHKNYSHVNIPTDRNPFISKTSVEEVREELPEGAVRDQEFNGKFVKSGSGVIKAAWFHITDLPLEGEKVRSWDLAATIKKSSDYYAGGLHCFDGEKMQIQDMKRGKLLWPDLKKLIMDTAEFDGTSTPILLENAGQQNIAISDLMEEPRMRNYTILSESPEGDKLARAMVWVSRLQNGIVTMLRGHWNTDYITECESFTVDDTHAHDDQIDTTSQAWKHFCSSGAGVIKF